MLELLPFYRRENWSTESIVTYLNLEYAYIIQNKELLYQEATYTYIYLCMQLSYMSLSLKILENKLPGKNNNSNSKFIRY